MKFTNQNVEKERKRIKRTMLIGLVLLIISFGLFAWATFIEKNTKNDVQGLHSIIISDAKDLTKKNSYIDLTNEPYKFAVYEKTTDAYYFVWDKDYMYVAYMTEDDYTKFKEATLEKPIKIEGVTKETPSDIKKIAIEVYNDAQTNEEDKLLLSDFDAYFGSVYLDLTVSQVQATMLQDVTGLFVGFIAICVLIYSSIINFKFKKGIKKLDSTTLLSLDGEMNESESFYYQAQHLYLTRNYIINFYNTFKAIPYKDIIWMYPYEYRLNGVKSNQSIIVVTKDGKKHTIANINVITKKKEEAFNEIFNTIATKNKNIILGYNKESRKKAKEEIAKYKNN